MKSLTVRLPDELVSQIEAESHARKVSKSDIVRERLTGQVAHEQPATLHAIADLIGAVEGLPTDLSQERKKHLATSGYGRKHSR